jgi:hypothetical protein
MRRLLASGVAALVVITTDTASLRADVIIQVPFVTIRIPTRPRIGRPARTVAMPARPVTEAPPQVEPPPGVPLEIGPPAPPVPQVGQVVPTPAPSSTRPLTLQEFAFSFRPSGGPCAVVVQHPFTGAPVRVTLALPPGTPTVKIRRGLRHRVQLLYGRKQVEIVFLRNGQVRVHP